MYLLYVSAAGLCIFCSFVFLTGGIVLITLSCELTNQLQGCLTLSISLSFLSFDAGQVAAGQAGCRGIRDRLCSAKSPLAVRLAVEPVEQDLRLQLCPVCRLHLDPLARLYCSRRGPRVRRKRTLRLHSLLQKLHV